MSRTLRYLGIGLAILGLLFSLAIQVIYTVTPETVAAVLTSAPVLIAAGGILILFAILIETLEDK